MTYRALISILASLSFGLLLVDTTGAASVERGKHVVMVGDSMVITVFGHADLTGTYRVDSQGYIQLPVGDPLLVSGLTLQQSRKRVVDHLAKGFLKFPQVSIAFAELQPIYVLGFVKTPGPIPFRPGITVAEAIAAAGGVGPQVAPTDRTITDFIAIQRQMETLEQNKRHLLIRLARIEAERAGAKTLSLPKDFPTDARNASNLIAHEQEALTQSLERNAELINLMERQKPRLASQIDSFKREKLAAIKQLEVAQRRLDIFDKLKSRGLSRETTSLDILTAMANAEANVARIDAQISQLARNMGDLEIKIQETRNARQESLDGEKREALISINDINAALPLLKSQLTAAQGQAALRQTPDADLAAFRLYLTRKASSDNKAEIAKFDQLLGPGDIVQVQYDSSSSSSDRPSSTQGRTGFPPPI